jgi:hypothetical protein
MLRFGLHFLSNPFYGRRSKVLFIAVAVVIFNHESAVLFVVKNDCACIILAREEKSFDTLSNEGQSQIWLQGLLLYFSTSS